MEVILQSITLFVITIGGMVGILQLYLLQQQMKAQHDWNRRVTTLRYSFSDNTHIREIRSKLDKHLKIASRQPGEISLEEIQKLSKSQYPSIRTDLQYLLGHLENMCVAMKNSIIDEQTCEDMLKGIVILYYRFFSQYIDDVRKIRNNPRIYEHFEAYARKWDERKELKTRTPTG